MARNIIIVMICGVLVFALVWKVAPEFLATALQIDRSNGTIEEAASAEEPAKQQPAGKAAKAKTAKGKVAVGAAKPLPEVAAAGEQGAIETPVSQPTYATYGTYAHRRPHVVTDQATLYSSNAPTGRVVRVLQKDEVLELHFKVDNGGQEWMYVNVPNQQVSGFLSGDSMME
jgi:hypothetical protein